MKCHHQCEKCHRQNDRKLYTRKNSGKIEEICEILVHPATLNAKTRLLLASRTIFFDLVGIVHDMAPSAWKWSVFCAELATITVRDEERTTIQAFDWRSWYTSGPIVTQ
jgi:hypothetical protein